MLYFMSIIAHISCDSLFFPLTNMREAVCCLKSSSMLNFMSFTHLLDIFPYIKEGHNNLTLLSIFKRAPSTMKSMKTETLKNTILMALTLKG